MNNNMSVESVKMAFGQFKVVDVTFVVNDGNDAERARVTSNIYSFKCPIDLKADAGGLVVVDTDNGFKLAKVVGVFDNCFQNSAKINKAVKWVVDSIDLETYNVRRMAEEQLKYAKNRLEEKKQAFEQVQIYEYMAKTDPEARELLKMMKISQGIDPEISLISDISATPVVTPDEV